MNIHYNKYIKYKLKYINLLNNDKNGGGTEQSKPSIYGSSEQPLKINPRAQVLSESTSTKQKKNFYIPSEILPENKIKLLLELSKITEDMDINYEMSQTGSRDIFLCKVVPFIEEYFHKKINTLTLTESNVGFGGFTYLFITLFKHLNLIELDLDRLRIVNKNLLIYQKYMKELSSYKLISDNFLYCGKGLKQDIVFADFPWGGKKYKWEGKLRLSLKDNSDCDIFLDDIIVDYLQNCKCEMFIFLKPFNFDMDRLGLILDKSGISYKINEFEEAIETRKRTSPSIVVVHI